MSQQDKNPIQQYAVDSLNTSAEAVAKLQDYFHSVSFVNKTICEEINYLHKQIDAIGKTLSEDRCKRTRCDCDMNMVREEIRLANESTRQIAEKQKENVVNLHKRFAVFVSESEEVLNKLNEFRESVKLDIERIEHDINDVKRDVSELDEIDEELIETVKVNRNSRPLCLASLVLSLTALAVSVLSANVIHHISN